MTVTGVAATLAGGVYTAFFAGLQYLGVRGGGVNPSRRCGAPPPNVRSAAPRRLIGAA